MLLCWASNLTAVSAAAAAAGVVVFGFVQIHLRFVICRDTIYIGIEKASHAHAAITYQSLYARIVPNRICRVK